MTSSLRVLTVIADLGPGGMQRVAQNYALGYAQSGWDSAVLGYEGGGVRERPLAEAGVTTFTATDTEGWKLAVRAAVEWQPDVVHIHRGGDPHPRSAPVLLRLSEWLPNATFVETNVFSRADATATGRIFDIHLHLTRWCMWKWQQWSRGIRPAPVSTIVPYAVEPSAFFPDEAAGRAFRSSLGIESDAIVFGRIGQASDAKWDPSLLDSFEHVATEYIDAHLLLIAPSASVRQRLKSVAPGVSERVHIVDFLNGDEQLRAGYNAMDVFVLVADIGESFGMVLAEAMLCEVPVVARSRPAKDNSQVEVVGHGVGGLVASGVTDTTEAMKTLYADPGLRARLGKGGRQRVQERYSVAVVMPRLIRVVKAAVYAPSRDRLRQVLESESDIITEVTDGEIKHLLRDTIGHPSLRERVLTWAVHQPALYRLWRYMRG